VSQVGASHARLLLIECALGEGGDQRKAVVAEPSRRQDRDVPLELAKDPSLGPADKGGRHAELPPHDPRATLSPARPVFLRQNASFVLGERGGELHEELPLLLLDERRRWIGLRRRYLGAVYVDPAPTRPDRRASLLVEPPDPERRRRPEGQVERLRGRDRLLVFGDHEVDRLVDRELPLIAREVAGTRQLAWQPLDQKLPLPAQRFRDLFASPRCSSSRRITPDARGFLGHMGLKPVSPAF
jgi:hypothetical protein